MRHFIAVLTLLAAAPLVEAGSVDAGCKPVLLAQAQLEVTTDGNVYIPLRMGDKEVLFELRIGSGIPMFLESSARSLGLVPKPMNGYGEIYSRGKRPTQYVELKDLKLGSYRFLNRAAPMIPEEEGEIAPMVAGKLVAGMMGATLFQRVDAEIYLAERQLKLFKPGCVGRSPVYWGGDYAEIPMHIEEQTGALKLTLELEGRKVETGLQTGESVSTIDVNATRQFFGFDENSTGVEVVQSANGGSSSLYRAMSLTGSGLAIQNASIRLRQGGCKLTGSTPVSHAIGYSFCLNIAPFNLGTDLLSQLRIYLSNTRDKAYISVVTPQPAAGSGAASVAPQ